ncbi:MAG: di-trans,poly-cis-decaprenylcistransferase [Armatimonadetes bacterium]|nr:di-trans,poly-cis-decaprenylcistransferase [Armatimonadota bacterium]
MDTVGIDQSRLPRHIAIIMDGNGRWAESRGLFRIEGHCRGESIAHEVVEACGELGIGHLTLYTFSAENWRRSGEEVQALMHLIETVARRQIEGLHRRGVRVNVLGRLHELPCSLREELERDMALTRHNCGLRLNLAINYGGRAEIADAARRLAERVARGELLPAEINEERLREELYDPTLPDPDLLIRTGGEMRISNFLLWEIAYSEIWVTQTLWPDFGAAELLQAIRDYQARERRFGAVPSRGEPVGAGAGLLL